MADCESCKERQKQAEPIPFIAYESAMARMERSNRRLWIALIIVLALLFGTNVAWVWYDAQMEDVSVEQEVDTGEGDAYVAGVGDVIYGESQANG